MGLLVVGQSINLLFASYLCMLYRAFNHFSAAENDTRITGPWLLANAVLANVRGAW